VSKQHEEEHYTIEVMKEGTV